MRTTIDLPDTLYRQIKARAALEGRPVKALVSELLQRGLAAPETPAQAGCVRSLPPTVAVSALFPLSRPGNAALFELLDDPPQAR